MIVENEDGGAVVVVAASGQIMEEGWKVTTTIRRLLFTKEDPWNIHKMLGCLVLVSYLYRLSQFGKTTDMGFIITLQQQQQPDDKIMTLATVTLHLSLNLSSFVFTIPKARIKSDGGRIWPEYRLHSLIFLCRSLACIVLNWSEQQQQQQQAIAAAFNNDDNNIMIPQQPPDYKANLWIVLGTMVAGDIASCSVGTRYHSNSIRDLSAPIWVKYYFSLMQFYATAVHLFGFRRCSIYFYFVVVIQVTAFLLTLRRKNIVSHELNVVLYGSLLACGLSIGIYECLIYTSSTNSSVSSKMIVPCAISSVACTAALWRMGPSIWPGMEKWLPWIRNKYLIWTVMYFYLNNVLRPVIILTTTGDDDHDHDDHEIPIFTIFWITISKERIQLVALIQFAMVVLYGINKQLQEVVRMKEKTA